MRVHHPPHATPYLDALQHGIAGDRAADVRLLAASPGVVSTDPPLEVHARPLSHVIETLGWRFEQPAGRSLLPERLDALGIAWEARSELTEQGVITHRGRRVHVEEVSEPRRPAAVAHVMDTRVCDGAYELAADVDLLLIESTFLDSERDLAEQAGHLTAAQAARIGAEAGARRVVLTHFSRRYPDSSVFGREAARAAPGLDIHVATDLDLIPLSGPPSSLRTP